MIDQESAESHAKVGEQCYREGCGQDSIAEVDPPFPGRGHQILLRRVASRTTLLFDQAPQIAEGSLPQVRDIQIVAQEVIAIQLDEGYQIQKGPDPGDGHHDQRRGIEPGRGIRDAPD